MEIVFSLRDNFAEKGHPFFSCKKIEKSLIQQIVCSLDINILLRDIFSLFNMFSRALSFFYSLK